MQVKGLLIFGANLLLPQIPDLTTFGELDPHFHPLKADLFPI